MDGDYPNRINMSDQNSAMFGSSYSPGTPHPNFEVSEFFELEDWTEEDQSGMTSGYTTQSRHQEVTEVINSSGNCSQHATMGNSSDGGSSGQERKETKEKVAFKTKSEVEILDDGFKWRKYGKKMVKNSPNPRNYYRCSVEGCPVKKRIERDKEDHRYVITTYEGIHNHQGPSQF